MLLPGLGDEWNDRSGSLLQERSQDSWVIFRCNSADSRGNTANRKEAGVVGKEWGEARETWCQRANNGQTPQGVSDQQKDLHVTLSDMESHGNVWSRGVTWSDLSYESVWRDWIVRNKRGSMEIGKEAIAGIQERGVDDLALDSTGGGGKKWWNSVMFWMYDYQERWTSKHRACENNKWSNVKTFILKKRVRKAEEEQV